MRRHFNLNKVKNLSIFFSAYILARHQEKVTDFGCVIKSTQLLDAMDLEAEITVVTLTHVVLAIAEMVAVVVEGRVLGGDHVTVIAASRVVTMTSVAAVIAAATVATKVVAVVVKKFPNMRSPPKFASGHDCCCLQSLL